MRPILLALITSMFACIFVGEAAAADKPEPKYEGKPLAYWVERFRKSETDWERDAACKALRAFGPDAAPAIPEFLEMLDDRSMWYCQEVCSILVKMGPAAKPAVLELARSLKEKTCRHPDIIMYYFLGHLGPHAKEAVSVLVELLEDEKLGQDAIQVLCTIGTTAKSAIPAIGRAIKAGKNKHLIGCLRNFGGDAMPLLLELAEMEDVDFKVPCAETFGKLGETAKKAMPRLMKYLKDQDLSVQRAAALAIWQIDKKTDGVMILANQLEQLGDDATDASRKLEEIGPGAIDALPLLEKAAANPASKFPANKFRVRGSERQCAMWAIEKISPERAKKLREDLNWHEP